MSNYGLKIFDTIGNSSLIVPNIAQIISSGTITLPNALNGDGTYGVDIDLPGDYDIDNTDLGMIVQIRDFDYRLSVHEFTYPTNNSLKVFYGDDSYTYYDKDVNTGVMTSWTPGDMTASDITKWNHLIQISLLAGWDKFGSTSKAMRIFAAVHYGFLNIAGGTAATTTFYGRDTTQTVNGQAGYILSETQGSTLQTYTITSDASYRLIAAVTTNCSIYRISYPSGATLLGNNVASDTSFVRGGEGSVSGTWACPLTNLTPGDAVCIVVNVWCYFRDNAWLSGDKAFAIVFITTVSEDWCTLESNTWTVYRYITAIESTGAGGNYATVTLSWGNSTKEMKTTGIKYKPLVYSGKDVATIGTNGVSEVDYIMYMKKYRGD